MVGAASRSLPSADRLARLAGGRAYRDPVELARNARVLFITTPDRAVVSVAEMLASAGAFHRGQVVLHTSGALSSRELSCAAAFGAYPLSVHPLQSIASRERGIDLLPGSTFVMEGDSRAAEVVKPMVTAIGGHPVFIDTSQKRLYHAAACIASNYLVATLTVSLDVWQKIGVPRERALKAILPLVRGTVDNVATVGIPAALTGPIERGDASTVARHLDEMREMMPEILPLYTALGRRTMALAREKGSIGQSEWDELARLLGSAGEGPDLGGSS